MQKKYILAAAVLCLVSLSYLFYHACKRDTIVIRQTERVSIPDSSWLYGNFNLKELRKDIAWSSIANGDFSKLFKSDTSTNILLKILKSPSSYSITEQNNIQFFSLWKNKQIYTGLLFTIETNKLLLDAFKSTSFKADTATVNAFRTKEGYWIFNNQQLLFIGRQDQDSILAHAVFKQRNSTLPVPEANDSLYASCVINTLYYQDSTKHPLLDSANIEINLKNNDEYLAFDWTYSGIATSFLNQATLPNSGTNAGFHFSCNPTKQGLEKIVATYQSTNDSKQQHANVQPFISMLQNAICSVEFNGWKKQKKSYFISELNDEFEMMLVKKDSSFLEPSFIVQVAPADKKEVAVFLTYLQKQGLISKNKQSPFRVTLGDFESELLQMKDSSLVYQNKHAIRTSAAKKHIEAACILQLQPAQLENLFTRENHFRINKKILLVEQVYIEAFKEKKSMHGTATINFTADKHPILALIQLLKQ